MIQTHVKINSTPSKLECPKAHLAWTPATCCGWDFCKQTAVFLFRCISAEIVPQYVGPMSGKGWNTLRVLLLQHIFAKKENWEPLTCTIAGSDIWWAGWEKAFASTIIQSTSVKSVLRLCSRPQKHGAHQHHSHRELLFWSVTVGKCQVLFTVQPAAS